MENLFLNILNVSISAGWLILVVFILRTIFKNTPRWIVCLFWLIVGIRLICPFTIESNLSLIPSTETVPTTIATDSIPSLNTGIDVIDENLNSTVRENYVRKYVDSNTSIILIPDTISTPFEIVVKVVSIIWIFGFVCMILYMIISYIRMKNKLKTATLLQDNIYQSEFIKSPFVMGIIKPKIYIPYDVDLNVIDQIIIHEKAHLERCDNITKVVAFLLLSVYWINPIVWLAFIYLCKDIEYATDEKVIKMMEHSEKQIYAKAILDNSINDFSIVACPFSFGGGNLLSRIDKIMKYKRPTMKVMIISVVLSIFLAVSFLTSPEIKSIDKLDLNDLDHAVVLTNTGWSHEGDQEYTEPDCYRFMVNFEYTYVELECTTNAIASWDHNEKRDYVFTSEAAYYRDENDFSPNDDMNGFYINPVDNSVLTMKFYKDDKLIHQGTIEFHYLTYDFNVDESDNEYISALKYSAKIVESDDLLLITPSQFYYDTDAIIYEIKGE